MNGRLAPPFKAIRFTWAEAASDAKIKSNSKVFLINGIYLPPNLNKIWMTTEQLKDLKARVSALRRYL
jgi:hypothetical protein